MSDHRRDFIKKGVALAAMSVGGIVPAVSRTLDSETQERIKAIARRLALWCANGL